MRERRLNWHSSYLCDAQAITGCVFEYAKATGSTEDNRTMFTRMIVVRRFRLDANIAVWLMSA